MEINIAHLYPENLNLYGDKGNIASLAYRLQKRGINCRVTEYSPEDTIDFDNTDIIFIGGGTDKDQKLVCTALLKQKDSFKAYVERGGVVLAVCGGYELMGKYFESEDGKIPALDILDIYTLHDTQRHIGNIVLECELIGDSIVGFENHSGRVIAGAVTPLGKVVSGFGNDGKSGFEGALYKNVIASYLHGALLPKNPKLTDYILLKALENKYGKSVLAPLDDAVEIAAHDYAVRRFS